MTPLAKQANGRIPRTVVAARQPAPVRYRAKQQPDGLAERCGQMGDRRVAGNDKIEVGDHRGSVEECIRTRIKVGAKVLDSEIRGKRLDMLASVFLLKADQADTWDASQRRQRRQRDGPVPVDRGL